MRSVALPEYRCFDEEQEISPNSASRHLWRNISCERGG